MVVNESGKRYISDIIDEWLETYDEYEEEESILSEIQPYRQTILLKHGEIVR
jgi:hypothetical protein